MISHAPSRDLQPKMDKVSARVLLFSKKEQILYIRSYTRHRIVEHHSHTFNSVFEQKPFPRKSPNSREVIMAMYYSAALTCGYV